MLQFEGEDSVAVVLTLPQSQNIFPLRITEIVEKIVFMPLVSHYYLLSFCFYFENWKNTVHIYI